jgi:hypothetical protein
MSKIHADVGRGYIGRRVICEILGRTGIREVQMSPDLIEPVVEHIDRLRRIGAPTGPDDYLMPNTRGGRIDRQRVGKILKEAAALATERVVARGYPPLPNVTPHSLRRTYISIALLANNFDVKWAMGQVGHTDSKMTMTCTRSWSSASSAATETNFDRSFRVARKQSNRDESRTNTEIDALQGFTPRTDTDVPRLHAYDGGAIGLVYLGAYLCILHDLPPHPHSCRSKDRRSERVPPGPAYTRRSASRLAQYLSTGSDRDHRDRATRVVFHGCFGGDPR